MNELGWSGVFNLQLIERDGRDYVIDLNPRFYVSLTLAVAAGLNLPAIWASLLLGLPFEARGYRAGVRFRQEKGDPRAICVSSAVVSSPPRGTSCRAAGPSTRCSRSAIRVPA